jgi:hypothetical protein
MGTRSRSNRSERFGNDSTAPPPALIPIVLHSFDLGRLSGPAPLQPWPDARRSCTRRSPPARPALGLARRPAPHHRAAVHRTGNSVLRRASRNRYRRTGRHGLRARRRGRALRRDGGRPSGAVDRTPGGRTHELRAGRDRARCGRVRRARAGDRHGAARSLCILVPAFRGAGARAVRVTARVARRHRAGRAAADAGERRTTRGDAPDGSSPSTAPSRHACRAEWCRDSRDRASPAPRAGRLPRRAGG